LSVAAIEQAFPIVFADYFATELADLRALQADGLVQVGGAWISVTPKGRLLIRNLCMVFDRYLGQQAGGPRFSRTI
jgi:oxygen-independent coproporphyrinogen-3 oxidase